MWHCSQYRSVAGHQYLVVGAQIPPCGCTDTTELSVAWLGWIHRASRDFFLAQEYPRAPSRAPCSRSQGSGGTAGPVGTHFQSCGWPGACGSLFSYEKPTGPGQAWKPPLQTHSSPHSLLANRRGPINRPARAARKKPSVLATGTSPTRQPEPEAPALPTGHPKAVTLAGPGRMDSLSLMCPSGD